MLTLRFIIEALFGLAAVCGMGYYGLCLWAARDFLRARPLVPSAALPPVTILKPLRGADRQMYEAFRSHAQQDYPDFQMIFGVADASDPAVEFVRQLQREFPQRRIDLVITPQVLGTNLKVSNLIQMLPSAAHRHLLINDSDILVPPDYLRRIMSEFADPTVGMVTTLYRGAAGASLGSKLESVGISTDFAAGVLAARWIEKGVHFALGSTLAFSRDALEKIGGLEPLVDYLADDYELGFRISRAGYRVVLSDAVVDTHLPAYRFKDFWDHQMRWARSTRDSRKLGYIGVGLTFGLPFALLALLVSGAAAWALLLTGFALLLRWSLALYVGVRVVADRSVPARLGLVVLRDVVALAVWVASFAGHTVIWRGNEFLLKDGKIAAVQR